MRVESTPLVSVLMPVYKTDNDYLREAIQSILNQTYRNIEFIIIDDCTSAENIEVIEEFRDERIKVYRNDENLGITKSLNLGIQLAKGKYVARMDADDISELDRLEKQVAFLEENSEVIVLGGHARILGENKIFMSKVDDFEVLKIRMLFFNCAMVHPTAMINKTLLSENKITYNDSQKKSQDYMMWIDCMQVKKIMVLDDIVLQYRLHEGQTTNSSSEEQKRCAMAAQKKILEPLLGELITDQVQLLHYSIVSGNYYTGIEEYERHFQNLLKFNNEKSIFLPKLFKRECYYMWIMMTVKGIVFHRSFKGIKSRYFWKAVIHLNHWSYYYKNFIQVPISEKKLIRKMNKKNQLAL